MRVSYSRRMGLWQVPIAEGPVPVTVFALAVILLAILAVRRWRTWRRVLAGVGVVVFVVAGVVGVNMRFGASTFRRRRSCRARPRCPS